MDLMTGTGMDPDSGRRFSAKGPVLLMVILAVVVIGGLEFSGRHGLLTKQPLKIIDGENPGARAVFATTNYHLFRSGVTANRAGLSITGIGSKTRWWFWPNAFVREWISLIVNRWKEELALLIALIAFFGFMSAIIRIM